MERKELYKPFPTKVGNYKYQVYVKSSKTKSGKKLIGFGDRRYQQYKDKLGHYSHLDHGDEKRRKSYLARHGRTTDRNTASFWSTKILW
jgi:hypothetical protein